MGVVLGQDFVDDLGQGFSAVNPGVAERAVGVAHFVALRKKAVTFNLIKHLVERRDDLVLVERARRGHQHTRRGKGGADAF